MNTESNKAVVHKSLSGVAENCWVFWVLL